MENSKFKIVNFSFILCVLFFAFSILNAAAQSVNQNFPTPVKSSEINGKIPARDIGDARLTSFFYTFNGQQGDVFINVVTKNFDGDIDVFTVNGLRPLTKIRAYSDNSDGETGRIIYLRQSEKLILRIEGRTPNDEPATFQIKFAGSFEPSDVIAENDETNPPEVKTENQSDVRVNSVGTIIEVKPKPTPQAKEEKVVAEEKTAEKTEAKKKKTETNTDETAKKNQKEQDEKQKSKTDEAAEKNTSVVVVTDNLPKKEKKKVEKTDESKAVETAAKAETKKKKKTTENTTEPNPLENIKLVVLFKDGTKIERPMSEVLRVNIDKGILTIVAKDGTIGRYSILDVAEMTIK
jgi:hypothetical protein